MPAKPAPACPICGQPARADTRPFCSPRCRQVDLGRWLGEVYTVPGPAERPDDEEAQRSGSPWTGAGASSIPRLLDER